ncbi:MAG: DUF6361 family protein [Ruminiclostridium sp.]
MQIGWIDFSKEQRSKVLSVLKLLSEPGAVDELGIGIIRDSFADILFPGTSTIQTRAKYFFIIPYILLELEKQKAIKPHEFLTLLGQKEIELIDILDKDDAEGVIGIDAREELKRKPSSIYWNALKTYVFFANKDLSISEYAKVFCSVRDNKHKIKNGGNNKRNDEEAADDSDCGSSQTNFWRIPIPKQNWREELSIKLTNEEAEYINHKIISTSNTKDSLLALILCQKRLDFCDYNTFADLDTLLPVMPDMMKSDYIMARDFAQFIYGAQIRYNFIFTKGENEQVNEQWELWQENIPQIDLDRLFLRLNVRNQNLRHFLKAYQNSLSNTVELDKLIIAREKQLKGASRSKLVNENLYQYSGKLINMEKLYYRIYNAQRTVGDIFEGLGEVNV